MMPGPHSTTLRFVRTAAIAALCAAGSCVAASSAPDHCIVGENAIGCLSQRSVDEITTRVDNPAELRTMIEQKLASGTCELFAYGERVFVTDESDDGQTAVRRPDATDSYWMPSSWSRPASECRKHATQQSVDAKIGMPSSPSPEPRTGPRPAFARDRLPPRPAVPCVFKQVMTDEEIAACRNGNR
jgi:hypothetical protein